MSQHFLQTEVNEEIKIKVEVLKTKKGWTIKKLLRKALTEFLNREEEKLNHESITQ